MKFYYNDEYGLSHEIPVVTEEIEPPFVRITDDCIYFVVNKAEESFQLMEQIFQEYSERIKLAANNTGCNPPYKWMFHLKDEPGNAETLHGESQ